MTYKQISLKLPDEILEKVDRIAKSRYKKRSEVIREAILSYTGTETYREKETQTREPLIDLLENPSEKGPRTNCVKEIG